MPEEKYYDKKEFIQKIDQLVDIKMRKMTESEIAIAKSDQRLMECLHQIRVDGHVEGDDEKQNWFLVNMLTKLASVGYSYEEIIEIIKKSTKFETEQIEEYYMDYTYLTLRIKDDMEAFNRYHTEEEIIEKSIIYLDGKAYSREEIIEKIDAMMDVGKERIADIYDLVISWLFSIYYRLKKLLYKMNWQKKCITREQILSADRKIEPKDILKLFREGKYGNISKEDKDE